MATGLGAISSNAVDGKSGEVLAGRTKSQGRQRPNLRFNETVAGVPPSNQNGEHLLIQDNKVVHLVDAKVMMNRRVVGGGGTSGNSPANHQPLMVSSMDRSTFRHDQSVERINEQSSLQLMPYIDDENN